MSCTIHGKSGARDGFFPQKPELKFNTCFFGEIARKIIHENKR
jgi:hypothetical protein